MDEELKKWIEKADNDFKSAFLNMKGRLFEISCFHSQQCVEKYLKAFLIYKNVEPPKTHDIAKLIKICISVDKNFEVLKGREIEMLTMYAVELRYPDFPCKVDENEAKDAIYKAKFVKEFVMKKIEG
ncbi:MAG TPA: HEPN domain-containing protein [Elusimicrobiales bacterium]|jgi:HEPN domain-containing protein|nr:HEPN domain-containing protein [Elusimicrobiales bacterium]HPO95552.1 HEPN domain-containing protein [Elusimicrobiales bacterium]